MQNDQSFLLKLQLDQFEKKGAASTLFPSHYSVLFLSWAPTFYNKDKGTLGAKIREAFGLHQTVGLCPKKQHKKNGENKNTKIKSSENGTSG